MALIAETYAIEIRKLKEKVEMYEKARMRRRRLASNKEVNSNNKREEATTVFLLRRGEDGENDDRPEFY